MKAAGSKKKNGSADPAYEAIMDAIVTQTLAPSQKVSENILCDMFGITRTVSRNLIEQLIAQQFLVSVSAKVTQVAPLTLLEIKQNFALRKILLPEVFALTSTNADFEKLRLLNNKIKTMLPIKDDRNALSILKTNKLLNLTICEKAGYPIMLDWARQLEDSAMRIYWLFVKTKRAFPFASDLQTKMFDAMKAGDSEKIRDLTHSILMQAEERILNAIFSNEQFYTQDLKV